MTASCESRRLCACIRQYTPLTLVARIHHTLKALTAAGDAALQNITWVNKELNPEQRSAVSCIVGGTAGRLPFIIWGPPGTGKTSTLVEAAAQVGQVTKPPVADSIDSDQIYCEIQVTY